MPIDAKPEKNHPETPDDTEFSIDELARKAGMTVRNVRAYQERGLVPPPERRGRRGIYDVSHLSRLRVIGQLLERGYSLANIDELIKTWEKGQNLSQLLGLETAITSPWSDEPAGYFTLRELMKMYRMPYRPTAIKTLKRVTELGLLERQGTRYRASSPRLIHAGAELIAMGVPLDDLLELIRNVRANMASVSEQLVQLVLPAIDRHAGEDSLPPPEDVPELADMIWRLRPLAQVTVSAELDRAMEQAANKFFGDRLAHIFQTLQDPEKR